LSISQAAAVVADGVVVVVTDDEELLDRELLDQELLDKDGVHNHVHPCMMRHLGLAIPWLRLEAPRTQ
jgi:hypothetical protein